MYCGAAFAGSRGEALSLLFFCRRFLFQIKRKCRNAGSVYHLIIVRSEGRNQLSTIQLYYNFVSATPISDSRKGCPYEVRGLKFVRIFERRAMFSTTVNNRHFENFVPLSRHRCVESPHPTKYKTISHYKFCGQIISVPTAYICCFERSKTPSQSRLTPSQLPCRGA